MFLLGSLGILVVGVTSPVTLLDFESVALATLSDVVFLLTCFVRGFSHHHISVWPFEIYLLSGVKAYFVEKSEPSTKSFEGVWTGLFPSSED